MEDWKSPSRKKENMAAATLKASLFGVFGGPSWHMVWSSCAGKWLASRGACSSCELDVILVAGGAFMNTTSTSQDFAARRGLRRNY